MKDEPVRFSQCEISDSAKHNGWVVWAGGYGLELYVVAGPFHTREDAVHAAEKLGISYLLRSE